MLMGRCPADLTANSLLWEVRALFIQMMYYVYSDMVCCFTHVIEFCIKGRDDEGSEGCDIFI